MSPLRSAAVNERTYSQGWFLQFVSQGVEHKYQSEASQLRGVSELAMGVYLSIILSFACLINDIPWLTVLLSLSSLSLALILKSANFLSLEVRDTILCLGYYFCVWRTSPADGGLALFLPRFALRKPYSDLASAKHFAKFIGSAIIDVVVISLVKDTDTYRFLPALVPYVAFLYLMEFQYRSLWKSADLFRKCEVQAYDLFQTAESPQVIVDGQGKMMEINAEAVSFATAKGVKSPWNCTVFDLFPAKYSEKISEMIKSAIKGEPQQEEFLLKETEGELMELVRHRQDICGLAMLLSIEPVKWAQRNCAKVLCLDVSSYIVRRLLVISELQTLHRHTSILEKTIDKIYPSGDSISLEDLWHFYTVVFHIRNAMSLQRHFLGIVSLTESEFDLRDDLTNLIEISSVPATKKGLNVTLILDTGLPQVCKGDRFKMGQVFKSVCDFAFEHATENSEVTVMCRVDGMTDDGIKVNFRFTFSSMKLSGPNVKSLFLKPKASKSLPQISKIISDYGIGLAVHGILLEALGGYMSDAYVQDSTACKILVSYIIPLKSVLILGLKLTKVNYPNEHRVNMNANTVQWRFREKRRKQMASYKRRTFDTNEQSPDEFLRRTDQRKQKVTNTRHSLRKITELPFLPEVSPPPPAPEVVLITDFSENGLDENVENTEGIAVSTLHRTVLRHPTDLTTIHAGDMRRIRERKSQFRSQRRRTMTSDQISSSEMTGYRCLLVEHNKYSKQLLLEVFRKHTGSVPDYVSNGIDALGLHKEAVSGGNMYTILFVDLVMADMDGFELTRKIRAREEMMSLPRATIVGLVSSLDRDKDSQGKAAGMDAVRNSYISGQRRHRRRTYSLLSDTRTKKVIEYG